MLKTSNSKDPFADLDRPVEVDCRGHIVKGTIDRIHSEELVVVKISGGKLLYATRDKSDPSKWVQARQDELLADATFLREPPFPKCTISGHWGGSELGWVDFESDLVWTSDR